MINQMGSRVYPFYSGFQTCIWHHFEILNHFETPKPCDTIDAIACGLLTTMLSRVVYLLRCYRVWLRTIGGDDAITCGYVRSPAMMLSRVVYLLSAAIGGGGSVAPLPLLLARLKSLEEDPVGGGGTSSSSLSSPANSINN